MFFDDLKMTGVSLRTAGVQGAEGGPARVFVQAFFENDQSGHHRIVDARPGAAAAAAWSVARLDVTGTLTRLYKIRIPSRAGRPGPPGRGQPRRRPPHLRRRGRLLRQPRRASRRRCRRRPGQGRLHAPPTPTRQHQLELLYKKDRIEDDIESLFIRCSSGFFASNVTIEADDAGAPVSGRRTRQGRGGLRPQLPPLVHHRELDRRERLLRSCRKGRRPSWSSRPARPESWAMSTRPSRTTRSASMTTARSGSSASTARTRYRSRP